MESLSTLRVAIKARNVENKIKLNKNDGGSMLRKLYREIEKCQRMKKSKTEGIDALIIPQKSSNKKIPNTSVTISNLKLFSLFILQPEVVGSI